MTILLLDVGNTRIKYALLHSGAHGLSCEGAVDSVSALLAQVQVEAVSRVLFCSTTDHLWLDQLMAALPVTAVCERVEPGPLHVQSAGKMSSADKPPAAWLGLKLAYADTLGADRLVAMVALRGQGWARRCASIVVDAGTAMTIDVVSASGEHVGGHIVPGLTMALQSLNRGTAHLPAVPAAGAGDGPLLGRSTDDCIRQGCEQQLISLMLRIAEVEQAEQRVLTGGDAARLYSLLPPDERQRWRLEPAWVLLGLKKISDLGGDAHTILSTYHR